MKGRRAGTIAGLLTFFALVAAVGLVVGCLFGIPAGYLWSRNVGVAVACVGFGLTVGCIMAVTLLGMAEVECKEEKKLEDATAHVVTELEKQRAIDRLKVWAGSVVTIRKPDSDDDKYGPN